MARRPKARLITGNFDLHDVSFRTELRAHKPSPYERQRVPPVGSQSRAAILGSRRLWQKKGTRRHGLRYPLRPEAQICLGHAVEVTQITVNGKRHWKWSVRSIQCLGVSKSLEAAQVTAIEEVFRYLGSPHNYTAFVRLAKLAGHEFL